MVRSSAYLDLNKGMAMAVNVDRPAKDVDITSAEYDVMLGNLQAKEGAVLRRTRRRR